MPTVKALALRQAAVEMLADEFDASLIPFTCAAVVIEYAKPRAAALAEGTGWSPERLALRVADEVHKRRTGVRAGVDWSTTEKRVLGWVGRPLHADFYSK